MFLYHKSFACIFALYNVSFSVNFRNKTVTITHIWVITITHISLSSIDSRTLWLHIHRYDYLIQEHSTYLIIVYCKELPTYNKKRYDIAHAKKQLHLLIRSALYVHVNGQFQVLQCEKSKCNWTFEYGSMQNVL